MSDLDRRQFLARTGQFALAGTALGFLAGCGAESGVTTKAAAAPATTTGTTTTTTTTPAVPRKADIGALRRAVKGTVYTRSSQGFSQARTIYNSRYADVVPLAVLKAASVADVQAAVKWAAFYGVPITARSGGHSYGGFSTVRKGLVVDMRGIDSVKVSNGTATIGPGNDLYGVYSALAARGLTIPGGSCPTVGFAGLALGGGMGLAGRKYGLTLDSVQEVQIVTADGVAQLANAGANEDLFWASRGGGGGNFGIATSFKLKTHPAPNCAYFTATWPWSEAASVLGAWQSFAPKSPSALTSICSLLTTGGGTPEVTALGQYFGTEAQLQATLAPFLRDAPGAQVNYGTSDYLSLVERWGGCLGKTAAQCAAYMPTPFAAKSSYVSKVFSSAGLSAAVSAVERGSSGSAGSLLFDCYGGAINEVAPSDTAFVHRDQLCCIQYYATGDGSGPETWLQNAHAALKPYVSDFSYQNYIDPKLKNYENAYYGANLSRLQTVKKARDPHGLFSFPQGIKAA